MTLKLNETSCNLTVRPTTAWLELLTGFVKVPGEDDIHERTNHPSEMGSQASRLSADLAHTVILQALGTASIYFRPASGFQVRHAILIAS